MMTINCEFESHPGVADPLHRATWCRLEWKVDHRPITRVFDEASMDERTGIYVPAWPLAHWMVTRWWPLLHEHVPGADAQRWVDAEVAARHCARTAATGYYLPNAAFSADRETVWVSSTADNGTSLPIRFAESVEAAIPRDDVVASMREFIGKVLARGARVEDARVTGVRADWEAIQGAYENAEERQFCEAAGRLGLDPMDVASWPRELRSWIEQSDAGFFARPMVADLLDTAPGENAPTAWKQVEETARQAGLGAASARHRASGRERAYAFGYRMAQLVRQGLKPSEQALNVAAAAEYLLGAPFRTMQAGIPPAVRGIAGFDATGAGVVVEGKASARAGRFARCRALFQLATGCEREPRLVTDARTWDQRASRAFAAELMAPRAEVQAEWRRQVRKNGTDNALDALCAAYDAPEGVIRRQLDNRV